MAPGANDINGLNGDLMMEARVMAGVPPSRQSRRWRNRDVTGNLVRPRLLHRGTPAVINETGGEGCSYFGVKHSRGRGYC